MPISRLLLIGTPDYWQKEVLRKATESLGELEIVTQEHAEKRIKDRDYELIIEDAVHIDDEEKLARAIRRIRPNARVVIVTSSPTWRRAREAFKAGAVDYIMRSLDPQKLRSELEMAMQRMLPPFDDDEFDKE